MLILNRSNRQYMYLNKGHNLMLRLHLYLLNGITNTMKGCVEKLSKIVMSISQLSSPEPQTELPGSSGLLAQSVLLMTLFLVTFLIVMIVITLYWRSMSESNISSYFTLSDNSSFSPHKYLQSNMWSWVSLMRHSDTTHVWSSYMLGKFPFTGISLNLIWHIFLFSFVVMLFPGLK